MSFIDLRTIVYGLWLLYVISALVYITLYVLWTAKALNWYRQIDGVVPRTARRISNRVIKTANVLNLMFYSTIAIFAAAIMTNIIAVENQYLTVILAIIAFPWVIVALCRAVLNRKESKNELSRNALIPRRLGILASARKDTYEIGG